MTSNNILNNILTELKQLRQDANRSRENRSASRPTHSHGNPSTSRPTHPNVPGPARKLLQDIANRPTPINICWYHKRHGIATNPKNCPDPSLCSWNQDEEIKKMKAAIKKARTYATPAQNRLTKTQTETNKTPGTVAATNQTATTIAPSTPTTPVETPTPQNWYEQIEIDAVNETLENDLLLSESE